MNNPKVSVFTTCFNSGSYLRSTLDSIFNQDLKNIEVIIVDGGSTDETLDIINTYKSDHPIKFYIEPGINIYDGFISAFYRTTGEYVLCMPISDLINSTSWLSKCAKILDNNLNISLVHGISVHVNDGGDIYFGTATREQCPSEIDFFSFWCATYFAYAEHTSCVRRNVYKNCLELDLPYNKNEFINRFTDERRKRKNFFFNNFLKLTYNFNVSGYLSVFEPIIAAHVREHKNQGSLSAQDLDGVVSEYYIKMIKEYRISVMNRSITHYFRDGNGEVIDNLCEKKLNNFIKETINYRLYDKIYFGGNDTLNKAGFNISFKIRRLISRSIRWVIWIYYKVYKISSRNKNS